jgi:hypothetical protein
MFSTANAALWAESTAALEEDVSEDAYRLVRKPAKKGSSSEVGGGARGERGKREVGIDDFDCLSNVESSLRSLHSKSLASQTTTVLVCLCRSDRRCGVDAEKKSTGVARGACETRERVVAGKPTSKTIRRQNAFRLSLELRASSMLPILVISWLMV